MAGAGSSFVKAGYTFPKPLIDINGKTMIQLVIENLKPTCSHKFIFICKEEHYDHYSLAHIFNNLTGSNYECVKLSRPTQGAACTVLMTIDYINNEDDLLIANSDQVVDVSIDKYLKFSRESGADGTIMTFLSGHPKWSYARVNKEDQVIEVAEKKVISDHATVGLYYFKKGSDFVKAAFSMIEKNIKLNDEFYICPVFNEIILEGKKIKIWEIRQKQMHSMGTPEDLNQYLHFLEKKKS